MVNAKNAKEIDLSQPGSLWKRVREQTEWAIAHKALLSIPTACEFVEQAGIRFIVRTVANLVRKDEAQKKTPKASSNKDFNPFLPYEEDLFVANLSTTHLCLLNKFNVVDHHLLIITRAFEEQEDWLNLQDFEAMWMTLAEVDGLVFYNAGQRAGASQRHKHLQLVPMPFAPDGMGVPIESLFAAAQFERAVSEHPIGTIPELPFRHALIRWEGEMASPLDAAKATLERYHTLLRAVGLLEGEITGTRQSAPYNLLAAREWMLIVPRSQSSFNSIEVNSLGFAGALLVRNPEQMQILKECSPLTLLQNVALAIAR
ncbi:phosphorylase [Oculatella sp. FACHB-28]|uniref:ATP adenylyltransferase family protein n=1 Tax=Oculatella sp. FACHB-28 TaxID=2692845 RepID=UPI001684829D|nr:phosphorylase [Oculatella sp. FACHB-28]MBD2055652.1 phosphorylase [Oculatella sp. FACHB-28]